MIIKYESAVFYGRRIRIVETEELLSKTNPDELEISDTIQTENYSLKQQQLILCLTATV